MAAKCVTKLYNLEPTASNSTRPISDLYKASICVLCLISSDVTGIFWLCEKLSSFQGLYSM